MNRRVFFQSVSALGLCGAGPGLATARAPDPAAGRFAEVRDRYFLQALKFNPVTATYLGGDGYNADLKTINGELRDYRPQSLAREADFYRAILASDEAIDPARLSVSEQLDRQVLRAQIAFMLHQLERRYHERAVDTYVVEPFRGVDWQVQQMADLGDGRLGTFEEWKLVVRRVRSIPGFLATALSNLKAGVASGNLPDGRLVERDGIAAATDAAAFFRTGLIEQARGFTSGQSFQRRLLAELTPCGETAARAFEVFASALREIYATANRGDRFAAGVAEYRWRLQNTFHESRSPEELLLYGEQQTAHYQAKIYGVAQEVAEAAGLGLSFGSPEEKNTSVRKVMEHLGQDCPKSDAERLQWYIDVGRRAVDYGRQQKLFAVPADYRLDVYPTPPVLQGTGDAAYYPAPTFKKAGVGRFYLTPTGDDPAALRESNRATVADTAVHEGFPGHDWHSKYMNDHAATIGNVRWFEPGAVEDSSSMWCSALAVEGWALYAEELMSEPLPGRPHGFYTAAEHLYELQGQLLRAVRVVVDVGLHAGSMSYDAAVDYFATNVEFMPAVRARAATEPAARAVFKSSEMAIYRYSKWPTQALAYNLGKAAILELREAYQAARGPSYRARDFHERYMGLGPAPPRLMREALLSQEIAS